MISDQNRLVDGITSLIGGANSSVDPYLLPKNEFSWGVNVAIRGGFPKTRPGFKFVKAIPNGVIQGVCYFKTPSFEQVVMMINGRLYNTQITDPTAPILDVTPAGETNNYISRRASLVAANDYLIAQDGVSSPIVYTGSTSFRSSRILEEIQSFVTVNITMGANNPRVNVASSAGLYPGMLVQAARGIPKNTVVVSVDGAFLLSLLISTSALI
jgi:hypothetical protein